MIPPTIAEIPIKTNLRLLKNILLSILSIVEVLKTFFIEYIMNNQKLLSDVDL